MEQGRDFEDRVEIRSVHHADKPLIDFPINLVDIEKLHLHEMVIEKEYEGLVDQLRKDGYLRTPILITQDHIILDGHHRFSALNRLGVKKIPAIILDYDDDNLVKVDTWHPIVRKPVDEVAEELQKRGLTVEPLEGDYKSMLDRREVAAVVGNKKKKFKVLGDREQVFTAVRELWLDGIRYADIPELAFSITSEEITAIASWPYTKEEIKRVAKSDRVFLPKTTRHFMDFQFPDYRVEIKDLY